MSQQDALKIKDEGADAIQVSNHGGRQLKVQRQQLMHYH